MEIEEIIAWLIFVGTIVLFTTMIILNKRTKKIVLENSEKIKTLKELNNNFSYDSIMPSYTYYAFCNSKRSLERYSIYEFFVSTVQKNKDTFYRVINVITSNIEKYNLYTSLIKNIRSTITEEKCKELKINMNKFLKYEDKYFKDLIRSKPITYVSINCHASYTSPAGRNHYDKYITYNFNDLKEVYEIYVDPIKLENTIKDEKEITKTLITDVLFRDRHRCRICGKSEVDGVFLDVDYIIPPENNGVTNIYNLKTICNRCNNTYVEEEIIESKF